MPMSIPVIDIAPFLAGDPIGTRAVARQWAAAFETIGFATIVGHGVPDELGDRLHREARRFFELPMVEKRRNVPEGEQRAQGYVAMGVESVGRTYGPNGSPPPADLCESLTFTYLDWERRVPDNAFDRSIFRPNIWPAEPPDLRRLVEGYFNQVHHLAKTLMEISALALELPDGYFGPYYDRMISLLRLVRYPDQPVEPLPGQLRYGAHTDYTGFTILRQDDAPGGLQVEMPDGGWIDVATVPGSFVINTGDLLSRWTNGRWKSNVHRVVNPPRHLTGSTERLSIVLFTGPNNDALIECLPTCRDSANPAKDAPIRCWDHLMAKLRASMPELRV